MALVAVAGCLLASLFYWPAPRVVERRLGRHLIYHFTPTKHVRRVQGGVEISPRRSNHPLLVLPWRGNFAYFHSRLSRRGAVLNHLGRRQNLSLIVIAGRSFVTGSEPARFYWRPCDGAIAITRPYRGPAVILDGVDPFATSMVGAALGQE